MCYDLEEERRRSGRKSEIGELMNVSMRERFRRKLLRWGKKNKFFRFCSVPVLAVGMFFFHAAAYLRGNGKRFSMVIVSFLLFAVFSSFSFPAFVSGARLEEAWNPISEEARNIVLAEEKEIDLDELAILDQEDELLEDEYLEPEHDMDNVTTYSGEEILELNRPSGTFEEPTELPEDIRFLREDWRLLLVNKQHSLPDGYEEQIPLGKINTMKGVMRCDERIIDDLLAMIQAAADDGVILQICSPYRGLERQEYLFNRKINDFMAMGLSYLEAYQRASQTVTVPNASEHQLGLALDIVSNTYTKLLEGFADTEGGKWLAANSCRFGFILRYPKGKEDITGIKYEPWHFRYVGKEAAVLMTEEGLTLEEFWELEEYWEK
ncbi:MAG: D-alanyl-D-alanine carboxypeptidase family protein [Roseburia sp.]|nr:D-alanyl-D-alanine carboxypeptidase family protein [Roseburia sp.]MCM1097386.1 D-alanyl-D-alanine carboxypeptidase family protein [Ruminococcus flavefaciens]